MCRQTVDFEAIHFVNRFILIGFNIFNHHHNTQRKDPRPVAADEWCAAKKKQTEDIVFVIVSWLSFMWFYLVSKKFQEINSFKESSFLKRIHFFLASISFQFIIISTLITESIASEVLKYQGKCLHSKIRLSVICLISVEILICSNYVWIEQQEDFEVLMRYNRKDKVL